MQQRQVLQQDPIQSASPHNPNNVNNPSNSPWLKYDGLSPHQGSVSMQRENINNKHNANQDQDDTEKEENEEDEENETEKDRLSSGFSRAFTIFISSIIFLTMCLLIFSNTRDGAFVQVQVTPKIPTDTSLTFSDIKDEIQLFQQLILDKYPFFKLLDDKHDHKNNEYDAILNNLSSACNQTSAPSNSSIPSMNISDFFPLSKYNDEEYAFEVFNFTLTSSIDDFWSAKAYELAFVIAAFSGAWPYIKLLLLLVVWLHPMKPKQRKKGLFILDQLGKYSFIDLYVCIFMVVSFYLTITEQLPSGLGLEVAVVVEIDIGVTTFAVATLVSMIYSMLFIYFDEQKRLKKIKEENVKINDNDKENKMNGIDCFENKIEKYSKLDKWKSDGSLKIYALYDLPESFCGIICRTIFLTLLIGNIWLCIDSIYTAPVRYDMKGLAGWAVDTPHRSYSIIGTVNKLTSSTNEVDAAWFCVIQYYMTVIIAPILISIVLVIVWIVPMNYKCHNIICHLLLPLQAWNALDVFLVGAVAASVELDQVSQWILNTNFECACGANGIIQTLTGQGCFSVKGNLTYGSLLLLIFVIFEWFALLYTRNHINKTHQKYSKFQFNPIKL